MNPDAPDVSVPLLPLVAYLAQQGHVRVAIELWARAVARQYGS